MAVASQSRDEILKIVTQRIATREFELPLLPEVAIKAMELARSPDGDASKLAELIQRDQAIAGQVLRVANSSAFCPRSEIVSLRQAIARLGMNLIAEITLTITLRSQFFMHDDWRDSMAKMWRHSVAAGQWAKALARIKHRDAENAFICGLLHGIGKPVVLNLVADVCMQRKLEAGIKVMESVIDGWYVEVGSLVATSWELPAPIIEVITFHRYYQDAPHYVDETAITACAAFLGDATVADQTLDPEEFSQSDWATDLNLYPDDCEKLLQEQEAIRDAVAAVAT